MGKNGSSGVFFWMVCWAVVFLCIFLFFFYLFEDEDCVFMRCLEWNWDWNLDWDWD